VFQFRPVGILPHPDSFRRVIIRERAQSEVGDARRINPSSSSNWECADRCRDGLDGQVNSVNFTRLAQNFNKTGKLWSDGGF
jgi:hypothetical protein